jgi:uncharacterized membrane protein YdbT with pleckstrin-like domain
MMVVHKSPVILAIKIIVLEILIELIYLLIGGILFLISQQMGSEYRFISPITQILLLPLQIGVLAYMLIKWSGETYEILEDEVVVKSGIFKSTEKSYQFRNMQTVVIRQTFMEKIIGAGTVSVFVPTLGTDLVFIEVPNPRSFADAIKRSIPQEEQGKYLLAR